MEEKKPPISVTEVRRARTARVAQTVKEKKQLSKKEMLHLLREANVIMTRQQKKIEDLESRLKKRIWVPGMRP